MALMEMHFDAVLKISSASLLAVSGVGQYPKFFAVGGKKFIFSLII